MKPVQVGHMKIQKFVEFPAGMPLPATQFTGLTLERFDELKRDMDPRCLGAEPGTVQISMHTFVLQTGKATILIDTCNGNHKQRTGVMAGMANLNTDYIANLAALGLKPEDVDIVMCTHLHSDHVGWNTKLDNGRWVPTFPKARYLMGKADVDFYSNLPAPHPQYAFTYESYQDSVLPVIAAGKADLIDTSRKHDLDEGLWLEGAPGHTPGTMMLHCKCKQDHAIFTGDIFHHPIQIQDPSLDIGADNDGPVAHGVRKKMIETHCDTPTQLFAAHFPAPTGGRIVSFKNGARWKFTDD